MSWSLAEEAFRKEVRSFLAAELPAAWRVVRLDHDLEQGPESVRREWQRTLFDHGWLQLTWDPARGGRGATCMMEAIFHAELVDAGAPPIWGRAGVYLLAPTLARHGSHDQRERFEQSILAGDVFFCQAFSEPDAGSDLAGLRTKAVRVEGGWSLSGQKCWSSGAMHADRAFLLARTDPDAPVHRGIGFFLVDLRRPGVSIRPTRQASGHAEFAEIFLQDVFVADDDVVDDPANGWRVAMTTFAFERAAIANAMVLERAVQELLRLARKKGRASDPVVRQKLAQLVTQAHVFRWQSLRDLTRYEAGQDPGPETSLSKMGWSETAKRVRSMAVDLEGVAGLLTGGHTDGSLGQWQHLWIWSAAQTIYGGTSEIQRNIVAERMLGLPRVR